MQARVAALFVAWLPAAALVEPSPADERGEEELRQLITRHVQPMLDAQRVVGGVVGMVRNGQSAVIGFGEIEQGGGQTPTADTLYEIGSITKAFTGTLLADMTLRGEAALDDPLADYLPEDINTPQRGDKPITLRHLATHTSGLPRLPTNLPAEDPNPYANYDRAQLLEFLGSHKPARFPGVAEYSNLGMGLLGQLLAERAGKPYEQLIVERITEPLGMSDTRITLSDEQQARFAPPYLGDLTPGRPWEFGCLVGCGALRSTAADLLKLAEAALEGGDEPVHRALAKAFEQQPNSKIGVGTIGLGWMIAADGVTRWHNGQTGGYSAALFIVPPANTAVVMLTNTACDKTTGVAERIVQQTLGMEVDPIEFPREVEVDQMVLKKYVGKYQLGLFVTITVTHEEGRLRAQLTGQEKFPIYAESASKFYYRIVDAQITFKTDDNGAVTGLTLHQHGQDMPAPRIKPD